MRRRKRALCANGKIIGKSFCRQVSSIKQNLGLKNSHLRKSLGQNRNFAHSESPLRKICNSLSINYNFLSCLFFKLRRHCLQNLRMHCSVCFVIIFGHNLLIMVMILTAWMFLSAGLAIGGVSWEFDGRPRGGASISHRHTYLYHRLLSGDAATIPTFPSRRSGGTDDQWHQRHAGADETHKRHVEFNVLTSQRAGAWRQRAAVCGTVLRHRDSLHHLVYRRAADSVCGVPRSRRVLS